VSIAEKKKSRVMHHIMKTDFISDLSRSQKGHTNSGMIYFKVMLGLFEPLTCAVSSISCVTSIALTCPIARRTTASAIKTDGNDE